MQKLIKQEPAYEPANQVIANKNETPISNYIRYGETEGLAMGSVDAVTLARQTGIQLRGQDRTGFAPVVPGV